MTNHLDPNMTNLTSDSPTNEYTLFEYASFVCTLCMLIFSIIGILGNTLSTWIFTRPSLRSSINVLLAGLSVIDSLMLATGIVAFVVPNFHIFFQYASDESDAYLKTVVFGPYQLGMVAQTCSVWLFVLISVERYLAVCHPLKVSRLMSVHRSRLALLIIVLASIFYNSVRILEYKKDDTAIGYTRWLRSDPVYIYAYYIILYLCTHLFAPFFIIITLNVFIWLAIRKSCRLRNEVGRKRSNLSRQNSYTGDHQHRRKSGEKSTKTTEMIFVVTVLFGVCNIGTFAVNLWEGVMPSIFENADPTLQSVAYLLADVSNTLVAFNSASTFLLYLAYCKKYRYFFIKYCLAPVRVFRHEASRQRNASTAVDILMKEKMPNNNFLL